jgi:hypothetical protein
MLFDYIILDDIYRDYLLHASAKEGFGITYPDGTIIHPFRFNDTVNKRPLRRKSQLLRMLTIFGKIDTGNFDPDLDWSSIKKMGLVSESPFTWEYPTRDDLKEADKILINFKKRFIDFHLWKRKDHYYPVHSNITKDILIENFDACLKSESSATCPLGLDDFNDDLFFERVSIAKGIRASSDLNITFATPLPSMTYKPEIDKHKIIDDLYYVARTKLTDEICILPEPKSLNDVAQMREQKEMIRFREVLSEWYTTLQEGVDSFEIKARRDLRKANKELTRLSKWRSYDSSPIAFWINTIGGHIPILSNVLSAIYTVGRCFESYSQRRHGWILLVQPNR